MKLQIAICDDEPILCDAAKNAISNIKNEYEIDMFSSGDELLRAYRHYDAIFLDVEMPGQSGMEVAQRLRAENYIGNIVFLTSHTEFMQDAFKVKAFRYLTKPIQTDALKETLEQLEYELLENEKLLVDSYGTKELIYLKDIIYIESKRKYTIHVEIMSFHVKSCFYVEK